MNNAQLSGKRIVSGRVLTGFVAAFLILDAVMKLIKPVPVIQATVQLGYPESAIVGTGIALLLSTLLYIVPRTSMLGAILVTGYMGGAVATNVRAQQPLFSIIFPAIFAAIAWAGLWLRDARLEQILPLKR
jgi:hypothetical protein